MTDAMTTPDLELAPEPPPKGVGIWLRDNLFSTPASGVMTVASSAIVLFAFRGLLAFVFNPSRRWDAVTFNMKLLMVQAYPQGDMWRVWTAVGVVVVLLAASIAVWRLGGMAEPRDVGKVLMGVGAGVALGGVLGPFSTTGRIGWILTGAVFLIAGYALRAFTGDRAKEPIVPDHGPHRPHRPGTRCGHLGHRCPGPCQDRRRCRGHRRGRGRRPPRASRPLSSSRSRPRP